MLTTQRILKNLKIVKRLKMTKKLLKIKECQNMLKNKDTAN